MWFCAACQCCLIFGLKSTKFSVRSPILQFIQSTVISLLYLQNQLASFIALPRISQSLTQQHFVNTFWILYSHVCKSYHHQVADLTLEDKTCRNLLFNSCMFGLFGLARCSPPFLFSPFPPPSARLTSWHKYRKAAWTLSWFSLAEASK